MVLCATVNNRRRCLAAAQAYLIAAGNAHRRIGVLANEGQN